MAVKRITKRWLINSLGVILIILIAIVIAFSIGIRSYYYSSVRQIVISRATVVSTIISEYVDDGTVDFSSKLRNLVENFEFRDKMELMAIDTEGNVSITSSGFQPNNDYIMPDFEDALYSPQANGIGEFIGYINKEKILAITFSAGSSAIDSQLAAMRYVVSLEDVDRQIIMFIALLTLIGVAIIFFVIYSSSYFINSIVNPVGDIGVTARKIAQGNFSVRLEKHNDDEIGELCDIINQMAQELSTNENLKNDFISSVSHELRTPLTAIKGWGETLLQSQNIEFSTMEKGMRVIIGETERLSQMVEELLDFSRIQSGRLKLLMDKIDIIAELSDAVLMFTERAKREGVDLIYEESDLIIPVWGDKNRLRQVFINIIDNALKYSDNGDSVLITVAAEEKEFIITITDTGCGISETDLPKIKTKFYKGNSTRRGSGIGLAVADEIMTLHEGSITITSKEGQGTTVAIHLPIMSSY